MLKTTKRYVISTNALNSQGFRMLSEGLQWDMYRNNSVMLYMHYRPTGANKDEVRALGNVREIEFEADGTPTGRLYFNDKYDFARDIYEGYENGTYNMVSIGVLPLEWSEAPEDLLPGQIFPTVKSGIVKEISCVDIGSNSEALGVALYDEKGGIITLSDNNKIKTLNQDKMKLITLAAETAGLLLLADGATPTDAHTAIQNLVTLADKQKGEIATLKTAKETAEAKTTEAEKKLAETVKLQSEEKLVSLVDSAIEKGKITADQKEDFVKLSYEVAKPILDKMPENPSIASQIEKEAGKNQDPDYVKLTYSELDRAGKLIKLKDENIELFKTKFKEQYGSEYKG
jgi:hypothetical protein